jgi:hypothetical protein
MKILHFTTAVLDKMPQNQRLPALRFLVLTVAVYLVWKTLSGRITVLETEIKNCNELRINRLENDIAIRDSQQANLLRIIEQNSILMRRIEKKVCNQ